MSHFFHIGAVKEITASELKDSDVVIFNGEPRSILFFRKEDNRIKLNFDFPPQGTENHWDMCLTNKAKVYILGAKRVTGMKDTKGD